MPRLIDVVVLDAKTGKKVPDALAVWWDQAGRSDARSTDGEGYANFGDVKSNGITIAIFAENYKLFRGYVTTEDGHMTVGVLSAGSFRTLKTGFLRAPLGSMDFIDDEGKPWPFAGYTSHLLLVNMKKGQNVAPVLDEAISYGANTLIVIGMHLSQWKKDNGFYYDPQEPGHYERLAQLFDMCANKSLRVCYRMFADARGVPMEQLQDTWRRSCQVMRGRWNVFATKGNESSQNDWREDDFNFPDMGGVLCSQGSKGGEKNPHVPYLDFCEYEVRRDFKMLYDAGTGMRQLFDGDFAGPATNRPTLDIEPGFFHDSPRDKWGDERFTDPKLALALGAATGLNCAGGGFGASDALEGLILQPRAAECATAYFRGLYAGFVR